MKDSLSAYKIQTKSQGLRPNKIVSSEPSKKSTRSEGHTLAGAAKDPETARELVEMLSNPERTLGYGVDNRK